MVAGDLKSVFAFFLAFVVRLNSERILRFREETILVSGADSVAKFLPFIRLSPDNEPRFPRSLIRSNRPASAIRPGDCRRETVPDKC